jgi:hypothetical protein
MPTWRARGKTPGLEYLRLEVRQELGPERSVRVEIWPVDEDAEASS